MHAICDKSREEKNKNRNEKSKPSFRTLSPNLSLLIHPPSIMSHTFSLQVIHLSPIIPHTTLSQACTCSYILAPSFSPLSPTPSMPSLLPVFSLPYRTPSEGL